MTDVKLSCWCYREILESIWFNDHYWIELLMLDINTWNHLPMCEQMIFAYSKMLLTNYDIFDI